MKEKIHWQLKKMEALSVSELYKILQVRSEVFVVEQDCVYLDADGKDEKGYHLCGWIGEQLVAYCRIVPQGVSYPDKVSIGRVLTNPSYRNAGMGKLLMEKAIAATYELFPVDSIKIGAQLYLLKFYNEFNFKQISDMYLEDNIPHVEMLHCR
ncbi:MAG: GNAT family N-acetyltransferase [Ferruginibacter sp.]